MTFLAPAAFFGLALLAIPIVVHLFKPRHVRQSPFSSLRWLHLTQQRMARRIQWHQVLLFFVRAAFITLLVMALARPLLTGGAGGTRDRIVVIDVSRSMGRHIEGRPRPIETARKMAADSLRTLQSGERGAVLLAGSSTKVLAPWTTDAAPHIAAIESLEPGPTATRLDSSLDLLRALLDQRRDGAAVDIEVLTDNTSGSWTSGGIASFVADLPKSDDGKADVTVKLIDVGLPAPQNAWIAAARLRQSAQGPVLRVEMGCVGEKTETRALTVKGLNGVEPVTQEVALERGRTTALDLPLPATFSARGSQATLTLKSADAQHSGDELPGDDELFVDLESGGGLKVLFIEPEGADESQRPGFALRTALSALGDAGAANGDSAMTVRSPAAVTAAEIDGADLVVLADVPGLSSALAESLTARVRHGAGLAVFLGPRVDAASYNERLVQPLRPAESLLPARLGSVTQAPAAGLSAWGGWNASHPLTNGLLDPLLGDLGQVRSKTWLRFLDEWPASDEVVARLEDGTAAVVSRQVGAGRVLVFNASPDDQWSDLTRKKSFVAVVDRMVGLLAPAGRNRTFAAGEAVAMLIPAELGTTPVVRTPSGATLTPRIETTDAGPVLRLEAPAESGFYVATAGGLGGTTAAADDAGGTSRVTFVVQPDRDESAIAAMDSETLKSWWSPASLEVVKPASLGSAAAGTERRALDPLLLGLAGLLFLTEMFLVHWLCPRMNPALAASPNRRRGFVAPLKVREEEAMKVQS